MLSKRRLVLASEIDRIAESAQDELLESFDRLSSRSMLVLFALDLDHRKRFYRTLREKGCVVEFPKLKGAAIERWAESFVSKQGFRISSSSVKKIVDLVGSDLRTLAAEIEKLALYAGKEKIIPDSAIETLVRNSRQHGIFELIGAIARRDRAGALRILANLLNMGEPPLVIVTMLARHCRQVLIVKDCLNQGLDARETGITAQIPFFILDQFLQQARTADLAAVQRMHIRLAYIDRMLKSTSLDGRMLLEQVICALI
jgi:DNA polymerase-3 subunit delta